MRGAHSNSDCHPCLPCVRGHERRPLLHKKTKRTGAGGSRRAGQRPVGGPASGEPEPNLPETKLPEPAASHGGRRRHAAVGPGLVLLPGRVLQLPARRRGPRLRHRAVHQGLHHLVQGEPVGREAADWVRRDAVVALGHRHRARRRRRAAGGVRKLALCHRRRLRLCGHV